MLMKRTLVPWIAVGACLTIGWSCTDPDLEGDGAENSDNTAEFLTYGFYADDNSALTQDYVATVASDMVITLPEEIDRTALIARFTTSEGDKVFVGATEQVSGETPNDFTYPVDYIVRDDAAGVSANYTVTIEEPLPKAWQSMTVFNDGGMDNGSFAMCISPADNLPYFFLTRTNAEDVEAGVVASFSGSTLTACPEFTVDSEGTMIEPSNIDIAADAEGQLYVSYYNSGKLSDDEYDRTYYVYTGSGSSWSQVGSKFGFAGNDSAIEIDPATDRPVLAFQSNDRNASIPRRSLGIFTYDGSAWSSGSEISDISAQTIYGYSMRVFDGVLYMGGLVQTAPGTYFVFRYENGTWQPVVNALPAGMSQTNMMGSPFAVASDGTVYLCAGGDEDTNGTWYITVYRCAPGETAWTRIASPIHDSASGGISSSSIFAFDLCNDLPVVLYKNRDTGIPEVVMLDSETLQWGSPVALGTVAMGSYMAMEFDSEGVGYAAFLDDGETSSLHVYKYDEIPAE